MAKDGKDHAYWSLVQTLRTTDGRELRMRRITEPSREQKGLLHQLGITFPEHLEIDLKCNENSAMT
ncbi:MAG: hypothetical protein ACRD1O_07960 [Terriglobia bacterium]